MLIQAKQTMDVSVINPFGHTHWNATLGISLLGLQRPVQPRNANISEAKCLTAGVRYQPLVFEAPGVLLQKPLLSFTASWQPLRPTLVKMLFR